MSISSTSDTFAMKREESDDSPSASSPASLHSTLSNQSSSAPASSSSHQHTSTFHSTSHSGLASPSLSSVSSTDLSPSPSTSHARLDGHAPLHPTAPSRSHPSPLHSSSSSPHPSSPDDSDTGISGFIRKTYNMVSDPSTCDIVAWDDAGDSFIVKKEFDFASLVLPRYFRHKNFSSFVRQLNFYGFHKRSHQSRFTKFQHPHFKRGQLSALHLIKRKSAEANATFKDNIAQLTAQVTDLKRQYDDLYRIQQQILYIFARYMKAYPLPAQMDAPLIAGPSSTTEERGGKRQRLIGDGSSSMPFSSIPPSAAVPSNSAPHVSTSTLAALLSSPSPILPSLSGPQVPSHLSARDQELAELTALQSVLSQIPAGQALLNSHLSESFNAQTAAAMSSNYMPALTRSPPYGTPPTPSPPLQHPPLLAATAPAVMDLTGMSTLSGAGGSLGQLNPLILSALGALSGAGSPSYQQPLASGGQQQRLDNVGMTNNLHQLSGLSSLSALPPLSSLSSSSPPLSAQDLLQLLQHAHPNNRASRISAIRQEQRMLEDDDDDLDDEDDFDDAGDSSAFHSINGTASDWLAASAPSLLPFTSPAVDSGRYVTLTSPPQFHPQPALDKSLSAMYPLPASSATDVAMDSYVGSQLALADSSPSFATKAMPLSALSLKTQEVGPLFSNSVDPYHFSHLHNQLAAGSASQNASSSVSMSTSTVSGATPLHLKPSSSIPLDSATLQSLTPALQATLQSTLAQLRVTGSASQAQTTSAPSHGGGGLAGYGANQSADGGDVQSRLVSQLQAIATVSKQLQSLHHPALSSSAYPSTSSASPPFTHPQLSPTPSHTATYHTPLHSAAFPNHYEEFIKPHQQQMLPSYAASHAAFASTHPSLAASSPYASPPASHSSLSSLYAREAHAGAGDGYYGGTHSSGLYSLVGHPNGGHGSASALHAQSQSRGHLDALNGVGLRNPIL